MIPASTRALAHSRDCFPVAPPKPQARRFAPIGRTEKKAGDLVLGNIHRPLELVS